MCVHLPLLVFFGLGSHWAGRMCVHMCVCACICMHVCACTRALGLPLGRKSHSVSISYMPDNHLRHFTHVILFKSHSSTSIRFG